MAKDELHPESFRDATPMQLNKVLQVGIKKIKHPFRGWGITDGIVS